jgi:hypothetical protein
MSCEAASFDIASARFFDSQIATLKRGNRLTVVLNPFHLA